MKRPMPPRTDFFYRLFIEFANRDDPFHPLDLERFNHFIWIAHSGRAGLRGEDLRHQLELDDFDPEDAERLAEMYDDGRELLAAYRTIPAVSRLDWESSEKGELRR